MSALNCKKIKPLPRPTTSMTINNLQPTTDNITHNLKDDVITNKTDGIHLNNHNKTSSANHTHITNHKIHKTKETLRAYQQESREMKENQKRLDSQLSHIIELLHKFTNQPTTNPQPQPFTSRPLPSQPLPNPKGGINMVHNENDEEEDEEDDDDWLYGLLAELEDSDHDSNDDEVEEEPERGVDDERVEEETKGETFFIATIFRGNEVKETEMPVKCEDPGPCLVTSKIRGVDIPECLCDSGACGNIMPYALYETLDLGPLKKSKEVFTTVDASIVTFEIEPEKLLRSEKRKEAENPKNDAFMEKGLRIAPPQLKKKRKKVPLNLERKKEKKKKKQEEGKSEKKVVLQCSSFGKLLGKLKIFKKILHHHKSMDAYLVKDNSKWK
ncbi:hypothetical protein PIB30_080455 [Stylosanthes scabra]|uniref:Uncharacterized protein n=1 Tax=Stylosanthes scabra TaxID=79078 RepID=A0ABU6SS41_9FABA|nr:hypothetical protein [Stylosanthes scabra]